MKELGAFGKQTLMVFNKIDALANDELIGVYTRKISGKRGDFRAQRHRRFGFGSGAAERNWEHGGCDHASGFR